MFQSNSFVKSKPSTHFFDFSDCFMNLDDLKEDRYKEFMDEEARKQLFMNVHATRLKERFKNLSVYSNDGDNQKQPDNKAC